MEYLFKGFNVNGEISLQSTNNTCPICSCYDVCNPLCGPNCDNLKICGAGQVGHQPY